MVIKIQYGDGVISLPSKMLDVIKNADKTELSVLVCAASGMSDVTDIAATAGCEESEVQSALNFWRGAGIVTLDDVNTVSVSSHQSSNGNTVSVVSSSEMPHYTGKEIEAIFDQNSELGGFVDEISRVLGKILSTPEINKLLCLVDYYRLPCEYLLLLAHRCVQIERGSVAYIDKAAKQFYNEGIVTVEALEERIRFDDSRRTLEYAVRKLFGVGERAFTTKEKRFIECWTLWQIPDDMLELVYTIAVDNTGKASMPYMNKVLSNWREAGYKTAADAIAAMEQYKAKKEGTANASSFDKDEFFEAALRHSMEKHEKK